MKAGLIYILFTSLVLLAFSPNNSGESSSHKEIQSCRTITSIPVVTCTLPESVTFLKKFSFSQIFSGIFFRNFPESLHPGWFNMPAKKIKDRNRRFAFIALGQKVLIFHFCNKSSDDDHHLWIK